MAWGQFACVNDVHICTHIYDDKIAVESARGVAEFHGDQMWVIPYHFSKSSHMTSLELGETWCTSSPRGSIIPAGV